MATEMVAAATITASTATNELKLQQQQQHYRAITESNNSDDSAAAAADITTNTNDNQALTSLSKPSISVKSWFKVCSRSSLELMPPRTLARASSSSMKMMLGCDATPL